MRKALAPVVLLFVALSAWAQSATTPSRPTSPPYTGDLSIFETPGREQRLHIEKIMDLLAISPGKNVADIGAGSGWFTVRAARRVTASGTVYAVEINPEAIRYIDQRATKENLPNIKTVLGRNDDPLLPPQSVNAVLLLKTYHEVAHPMDLMRHLRESLRPGAKVGIIDRDGNGTNHGIQKAVVLREMKEAGYKLADEQDSLVKDDDMDYFLIFTAP